MALGRSVLLFMSGKYSRSRIPLRVALGKHDVTGAQDIFI